MPLYLNQMLSVFFCALTLFAFRKKDILSILCCLFVYGTFYFFSSIFVVFGNDSAEPIVNLHITGMGDFVRAVTVLFLLYIGFRIYRLRIHTNNSVISVYALSIALMSIGATTQLFTQGFTTLQYSNVISLILMLSLIVFGAGAWKASELRGRLSNSYVAMMVLLVFFSVVIAFFEVYTGKPGRRSLIPQDKK